MNYLINVIKLYMYQRIVVRIDIIFMSKIKENTGLGEISIFCYNERGDRNEKNIISRR